MKTKLTIFLSLVTLALALPAAEGTNSLYFPASGFSIAPLGASSGEKTVQILMMFLPATNNFAGNVNVQIQPYGATLEEYVRLTLDQCKDAGLKVIAQNKAGKSAVVFEYSGAPQGRALHWYARAEKTPGHVYLVTATAARVLRKQLRRVGDLCVRQRVATRSNSKRSYNPANELQASHVVGGRHRSPGHRPSTQARL
jgi:hypothetical protein